ncbi:MAG: lasso peptide biosynthesis B2 protein [Pseudomonadota bacterium]
MRETVRDLARVARGGQSTAADAARAVTELALARIRHALTPVRNLPLGGCGPKQQLTAAQQAVVSRVRYVVPRVGRRVPWRSDCLVQALAARRWLAKSGIDSAIRIGGRINSGGAFEAHAWLTAGDTIVTGWDIDRFAEFAAFPLDQAWPGR